MPKTFRENLREELDYQDMKVKALAVATGIPKPTLDCYLSTRQVIPPADIAVKIARTLNVSVEYLVTGENISLQNNPSGTQNKENLAKLNILIRDFSRLSKRDQEIVLMILRRSWLGAYEGNGSTINFCIIAF